MHENEDEKVFELENVDQIRDHNHSVDVADIIASDMNNDMHKVMSKDLTAKPSVVKKKRYERNMEESYRYSSR